MILIKCVEKRWTVLLIIMTLSIFYLSAQDKKGKISGRVTLVSEEKSSSGESVHIEGKTFFVIPVTDATLEFIKGKDTLRTVSNGSGYYVFREVPYGEYLIKARHISYISSFQRVNHASSDTKKDVQMKEETFLLDEIKVKGEIPLLTLRGDTVVINPLAVKTMEGDAAKEIIRQVPGITIDEKTGAITAFGEPLTRTYVGGKLIFGEDARVALDNLDAALVSKMKIYDEVTGLEMGDGGRFEARKRRVMNIETTKEILNSRTGHAIAALGRDIDDNITRYRFGGTINFFSEKLFYNANVFTNNTNTPDNNPDINNKLISTSTGEGKIAYAGVGYKKLWGEKTFSSLTLNYSYSDKEDKRGQTLHKIYFPNELYYLREYENKNRTLQNRAEHKTGIDLKLYGKVKGRTRSVTISHNMVFNDSENFDYSRTNNIVNDAVERMSRIKRNESDSYNIKDNINLDFIKNVYLTLSGNFQKGIGESWRSDTSFTGSVGSVEKIFRSSPVGSDVKMDFTAGYRAPRKVFSYQYQFTIQKGKSKELRFNLYDLNSEEIDYKNSFDFSTNNTIHIAKLIYTHNKKTQFFPLDANISFKSVNVYKDESLPTVSTYSKRFNAVLFSINNSRKIGDIDFYRTRFLFNYNTNSVTPSVEQIRNQIDDSDPQFLVAGNPDLKQTYTHNLELQFRRFNPNITVSVDASLMRNQIVPRQRFFPEGSLLPEFNNYPVAANATLTTYENLNGTIASSLKSNYNTRISNIKTTFDLTAEFTYNRQPSFVQEKINITNSFGCQLKGVMRMDYSNFRITLAAGSQYLKSVNTQKNGNEYFNQTLSLNSVYNIGKYLFAKGQYNLALYKPLTKGGIGFTNNILSLSGGLKLLKGRLNIDLSVYDILNRSTDFKSIMYTDYVQNSWTPTFGRYCSLNVLFKFRSTQSPKGFLLNTGFVPVN